MRDEQQKGDNKNVKHEDKNDRTIFVGNLPVTCTPKVCIYLLLLMDIMNSMIHPIDTLLIILMRQRLIRHFKKCGKIETVRLRGFVPNKPGVPKKVAAIR